MLLFIFLNSNFQIPEYNGGKIEKKKPSFFFLFFQIDKQIYVGYLIKFSIIYGIYI